jgi:periplasmic divalent cation tolerance protein
MSDGAAADAIIVLTNLPDHEAALGLAQELVQRKLAACVNVLAAGISVYRWRDKIETAPEFPVLIKTRAALYAEVEAAIIARHPYELPEVIAVPVMRGLPEYLDWVAAETSILIG